jgi:diaminopimelate decarboxylase
MGQSSVQANWPDKTPADTLGRITTPVEMLSIAPSGDLMIEGVRATDCLEQHGSPLFVVSEAALRANFRCIRKAFTDHWPKRVNILYAIKANNNFAVRAILFQEGAGGDCFVDGELYATFMGGADPDRSMVAASPTMR